jgi:hypothetical protein
MFGKNQLRVNGKPRIAWAIKAPVRQPDGKSVQEWLATGDD